jgi:hypothetical protein
MLTWLAPVLRSAGLTVVETDGWATRGYRALRPPAQYPRCRRTAP